MIKYCYDKWNANQYRLRAWLRNETGLNGCCYKDLVKATVTYILNDGLTEPLFCGEYWDANKITEIDNGDYQGTLLYLIPMDTYQPSECEYLMTYVGYGSCSGCDTLQHIQMLCDYSDEEHLTEQQIEDMMRLCKDIVCSMIKPYNTGWRYSADFDTVDF